MTPDRELLRRYAESRCEEAFAELVRRHLDLVYSAALRQVNGDAHLAQDVTQTVFTDLARKADSLSRRPVLTGWLYTSAHFAAAKAVRAERRRRAHEQEAQTMSELLHDPAPDLEWSKLRPVLDEAMHKLKETDREAILLRYFEQRPLGEIGARLGVSENTARMRVDRALDKLRTHLVRRGIHASAAVLSTAISVSAVQSAPAGLAATLTSASLAGAASAGTGISATLMKLMAMTKFKTSVISAIVVASVVTPLVMQHQAQARLRDQDESLRQRADQVVKLHAENERLSNLFARANKSPALSNEQYGELLRLRGEVGRLRTDLRELEQAKTNAPMSRTDILASIAQRYSQRINQLKQFLDTNPSERIPELQFMTDQDWLWLAGENTPDTEEGYQRAMSLARVTAEGNVARDALRPALQQYAHDNNGQFPSDLFQLKPYFKSPIDEAILQRWQILPASRLVNLREDLRKQDWVITQKAPVNAAFDQRIVFGVQDFHMFASAPSSHWDVAP